MRAMLLTLVMSIAVGFPQTTTPPAPTPTEGDFAIANFRFTSGETIPRLRIHYRTYGTPQKDAQGIVRNAVLVMHGTGGTGAQFVGRTFAGELFGPGQPLDVTQFFIILPDDIGHGQSSKPSDGLHAKFPKYGYVDMIEAEHRLVTEGLGVNHLRLVMGTSMGGMHTWLWGERYPDMMDALMPLASLPGADLGAQSRVAPDSHRCHPPAIPRGRTASTRHSRRRCERRPRCCGWSGAIPFSGRKRRRHSLTPIARSIGYVDNYVKTGDANDILYALESSRDYDPAPDLEKIKAPLVAVNSADDLVNPPELQILEREIKRVPRGRAVMIPLSDRTAGHGTHTLAAVWKSYLEDLLRTSGPSAATNPAPAGPNPDIHYQLGPDSLPRDGVPKGEVRGPFTLPSQAYPGTQHTYWVYVPAQYDPAVPASLMIFNDGQAFKNMEGDVRAPNVLDNLIYRREIPGDARRVHQPGPPARSAGADAAGVGRPDDQPSDRIQHARRQVRARDRRRADAGARQGLQHLEGSGAPRHRRREHRRDRRLHRGLGAPERVPQGPEHRRQLHEPPRRPRLQPTSSGRARRSRSGCSCRTAGTTTAASAATARTTRRATGSSRTSGLMQALTEKGYDVNYTWGIGRHGQKQGGAIFPDMMRWLWRDQPVSTDVNDAVERSFNTGATKKNRRTVGRLRTWAEGTEVAEFTNGGTERTETKRRRRAGWRSGHAFAEQARRC